MGTALVFTNIKRVTRMEIDPVLEYKQVGCLRVLKDGCDVISYIQYSQANLF
jgi:hypothetical protein